MADRRRPDDRGEPTPLVDTEDGDRGEPLLRRRGERAEDSADDTAAFRDVVIVPLLLLLVAVVDDDRLLRRDESRRAGIIYLLYLSFGLRMLFEYESTLTM